MAICIERLTAQHQRSSFDCGDVALNQFLQQQVGQLLRKGFGKTYVALAEDGVSVQGFVTLSAGQIQTPRLSAHLKLPRYPAPVLRIGRLAVDQRAQRQGIGQQLMAFALQWALEFSQAVSLYAVVADANHEKAKAFYEALGFVATLDDAMCLYLPIAVLEKARTPRS